MIICVLPFDKIPIINKPIDSNYNERIKLNIRCVFRSQIKSKYTIDLVMNDMIYMNWFMKINAKMEFYLITFQCKTIDDNLK